MEDTSLTIEYWTEIMRSVGSGSGIDVNASLSIAHIFDGMTVAPVMIQGGKSYVARVYVYKNLCEISDIVSNLHANGHKAFLLGVKSANNSVRIAVPIGE